MVINQETLKMLILAFLMSFQAVAALDGRTVTVDSYGAIANDSSVEAAIKNSQSISMALQNATPGSVVLVPKYSVYYIFSVSVSGINSVELRVEGTLIAISNITAWPISGDNYQNVLHFSNCSELTLTGLGTIDGQGYRWWVELLFNFIPHNRPHLVYLDNCVSVVVENLTLRNSPCFHLVAHQIKNFYVKNVFIWVDVTAQKQLLDTAPWKLPMFPFNTDGIDPSGQNILIQNITVENYDDAVAVKPGNLEDGCTENITVENANIIHSVGMSIGSVPPNVKVNCIRNVIFRNINFSYPFKAVYIKTNSGNKGFGIIDNIVYQNITIHSPILWPIYIGPQQQKEPDGGGDGIWPPPQPLVNITNIILQNVTSDGGWLNAGVLRCAASNPCRGIIFENVTVRGWASSFYICENVQGQVVNSTPKPCIKSV